jgi:ribosomal protein L11 methyltransferase
VAAVEALLDDILVDTPRGVVERPDGDDVELAFHGHADELPAIAEFERVAARHGARVTVGEVPDDFAARRVAGYRPLTVGPFAIRPSWAPVTRGLIDIALDEGPAFGTGIHPTTRCSLQLMLDLDPAGSFADLGSGSGVLSIAAARLGFAPITAVDASLDAIAATRANAARNGVDLQVVAADLSVAAPPAAATLVANVPGSLHPGLAFRVTDVTRCVVVSGFSPDEAPAILGAWSAAGFVPRAEVAAAGWVSATLTR